MAKSFGRGLLHYAVRRTRDGAMFCSDGQWRTACPFGVPGPKLYTSRGGAASKQGSLSFVTEIVTIGRNQ